MGAGQRVEFRGTEYSSIGALAREWGIPKSTLRQRLTLGQSPEEIYEWHTTKSDGRSAREAAVGKTFYQGSDCARGHGGQRYVSSGGCVLCSATRPSLDQTKGKRYDRSDDPDTVCNAIKGKGWVTRDEIKKLSGLTNTQITNAISILTTGGDILSKPRPDWDNYYLYRTRDTDHIHWPLRKQTNKELGIETPTVCTGNLALADPTGKARCVRQGSKRTPTISQEVCRKSARAVRSTGVVAA